jgi:hypothetical protein
MDVYRYNPYGMKVKVKTIEKKTGYGWWFLFRDIVP